MRAILGFIFCALLNAQSLSFPGPGMPASGGGGGGGITQVQKKTYASASGSTTHNLVFSSAPTSGNLLIIVAVSDNAISTPAGWTQAVTSPDFTDNKIYYKTSAGTETTTTVTISGATALVMVGYEYSGLSGSSQLDKSATAAGQGPLTFATGTTATTATANELLIAGIGIANPTGALTLVSWSNSFVDQFRGLSTGGSAYLASAALVVSSTGAYTTTLTLTPDTGQTHGAGMIATFK